MSRFCTNCGMTLDDDKKFCTECGTSVKAAEAPSTPPAQTVQPDPPAQEAYQQQTAAQEPPPDPAVNTYGGASPVQPAPPPQEVYQQTTTAVQELPPNPAANTYGGTPPVQPAQSVYGAYGQQTQTAVQEPPRSPANTYGGDAPPPPGSKYEPISAGGYIGIMLLLCIPIIGLILTIVWACGGCRKVNKRSLARATLIMMAIGLVISLILGFVLKSLFDSVMATIEEEAGVSISELVGGDDDGGADIFGGLFGGGTGPSDDDGGADILGGLFGGSTGSSDDDGSAGGLGGLLGGLAGLTGGSDGATNSDIEDLEDLQRMLEGLEGLAGGDGGDWSGLIDGATEANKDAEALNDGWPNTLRAYPGGNANAVASYRTEISDTTLEEMMSWIDDLKGDGFEYQDFYGFGMTEQDMLDMNAWWAYDGKTYLSVSYYDGVVTVDHTKELPDLESYFN